MMSIEACKIHINNVSLYLNEIYLYREIYILYRLEILEESSEERKIFSGCRKQLFSLFVHLGVIFYLFFSFSVVAWKHRIRAF